MTDRKNSACNDAALFSEEDLEFIDVLREEFLRALKRNNISAERLCGAPQDFALGVHASVLHHLVSSMCSIRMQIEEMKLNKEEFTSTLRGAEEIVDLQCVILLGTLDSLECFGCLPQPIRAAAKTPWFVLWRDLLLGAPKKQGTN